MANKLAILLLAVAVAVAVVVGSREIRSNNGNGKGMKKMKKISNSDYSLASRFVLLGRTGSGCSKIICIAEYIPDPKAHCERSTCGDCKKNGFCDYKRVASTLPNFNVDVVVDNDFSSDINDDDIIGVVENDSTFNINEDMIGEDDSTSNINQDMTDVVDNPTFNIDNNDITGVVDGQSDFETGVIDDQSNYNTDVVDDSFSYDTSVASSSSTINFNAIMNDYYDCDEEECKKTNTIEEDECFDIHPSCGRCEAINDEEWGRCTFAFNG